MTKAGGSGGFGHINEKILHGKLQFFVHLKWVASKPI